MLSFTSGTGGESREALLLDDFTGLQGTAIVTGGSGVHTVVHAAGPVVAQVHLSQVTPAMTDGMAAGLMASGQLDERALEAAMRSIPLRMFGNCADVAEAVCFLASGRARFITGQKLDVDGGYTA